MSGASTNENNALRVVAEVSSDLKSAFKVWYISKSFATEAEALRWLIRTVTNFDAKSQEKNPEL